MKPSNTIPSFDEKKHPRFFYGYVIIIVSFFIMAVTFGINYCFGVFFKPLILEFGWPRGVTSGAYSVMTCIAGILSIFAGRLSDRFGPRIMGIAVGLFLGMGFILLSRISSLWHFYLIHSLLLSAGNGACWAGLIPPIPRWFIAKRGLMTGFVVSGIGFGVLFLPPLAQWIISNYHWRKAYVIIGAFTLVFITAISWFLRRDPYEMGCIPYGDSGESVENGPPEEDGFSFNEAVRTTPFALICVLYFCYGYCLHTFMVHLVPYAIDIGVSPKSAAGVLAIIGIASLANRVLIAGASDRIGVKVSLIIGFSILFVSQLCIQSVETLWMLYLFGILFGTAYGGIMSMQALVVADFFGLRAIGFIFGTVTFFYTLGGATGPFFSGHLFDFLHSYKPAFGITAGLSILSLITAICLKPHSR